MNTKQVKKINQHKIDVEVEELQNLIPFLTEQQNILKQLECETLAEFELKLNGKTGFVNTLLSAEAMGLEKPYSRLLGIEKVIYGRLSSNDLTNDFKLKNSVKEAIKEKHTIYYTSKELQVKKDLDKVIKIYNSLDIVERQHVGFNLKKELAYAPFSEYRGKLLTS